LTAGKARVNYGAAMKSQAKTVNEYLDSLPADRRADIGAVRDVILANLPKGYEETIQYGMISYVVPHSLYPAGYHCDPRQPLGFMSLASQKNYMALHLMCVYGHEPTREWFTKAYAASGKKLDMGMACVRFKRAADLPLDVIGQLVARIPVKAYIRVVETAIAGRRKSKPARKK